MSQIVPRSLRQTAPNINNPQSTKLLEDAPLDTPQTFVVSTVGFDKIGLAIIYTYDSATAVVITPEVSFDNINYGPYPYTTTTVGGGVATGDSVPFEQSFAVSGDLNIFPSYTCSVWPWMRFTLTGTAATSNDTVTAYAILGAGVSI